jgi:4-carboxymuconolactone decarboxylase
MTQQTPDDNRLPPPPESSYSEAQRAAVDDFVATRKVGLGGPWQVLIRSPELLTHAQRLGDYLRFRSVFAGRLADLAVLVVAREWTQDYEFAVHAKAGLAAGLPTNAVAAIREGRRPEGLDGDAQLVVDFVTELMQRKSVSDATWARALARFGDQGCVDLCGLVGYYGLLGAAMNAARVPPPPGHDRLPRFPG